MLTLSHLLRFALLAVSTAACVLYFYAPIFWTDGNWFDAWGGFDDAVGRQLLLVVFIPGFVASVFLHFSDLVWKRLAGLCAVGLLQLAWLWNLAGSWIGGRTLIANRPWAEGHHGWDWLCLSSAAVCLAWVVWVWRRDWRESLWRTTGYGYKPLPGTAVRKNKGRYRAYAKTVAEDEPPERIKLE